MVSGAIFAGLISTQALFPHIFDRWVLPESKVGTYTLLLGGLGVLLTLIFNPEGVAGSTYRKRQEKKRRQQSLATMGRLQTLPARAPGGATSQGGEDR
jgi:branched-chain amino acid transport system permease protein